MNLTAYLSGVIDVLRGGQAWPAQFNLSRQGLSQSFIALALTVPPLFIGALGITTERARLAQTDLTTVGLPAFVIIAVLYLLSFSAMAYMIAMIFDRQDRFRPWVITRHWTIFFMALFVALGFGAYLLGWVPFAVANIIAFIFFMGSLAVDIRLAMVVANFRWIGAVYAGCAVAAMGLCVLVLGVTQIGG